MGLPLFHKHCTDEELYAIRKGGGEIPVDCAFPPQGKTPYSGMQLPGQGRGKKSSDSDMIVRTEQAVAETRKGYDTSDGYMES